MRTTRTTSVRSYPSHSDEKGERRERRRGFFKKKMTVRMKGVETFLMSTCVPRKEERKVRGPSAVP